MNPTWHYEYDRFGQQVSQRDPYGHVTRFGYDPLTGQRTSRTLPAVNGVSVSESWTYDALGRQELHTDFKGQSTTFHYDSLGRVQVERRYAAGKNPEVQGTVADEVSVFHYDELGRRDTVTVMNASGVVTRQERYGFDAQGRLSAVSSTEGTIHYGYNDLGQLTDTWTDRGVGALTGSDPAQASTWTHYGYDALGRLSTVTAKRLFAEDQNLKTTYGYDEVGNLASVLNPVGDLTSYVYDALNRLDLQTITQGSTTLASYDYVLLADGQRDYVIETDSAGKVTKIDWTYDADDRLVSEVRDEGNDGVQNGGDYTDLYTLDLVGNRLIKAHDVVDSAHDETITSSYSERDQLLTEMSTNAAHNASYTYDDNGSQITKIQGGVTITYAWDLHNRMASIDNTTDGQAEVTYRYSSNDVRVAETAGGKTTYFLNDPQNPTGYTKPVEERSDGTGIADHVDTAYVLGLQVIGQRDDGGMYYLLLDGHGSTRQVTKDGSIIDQKADYDAYGTMLGTAQLKTNWRFGGDGIWDPNSLFTYHLARFRDGARFVSYDSFEADPASPANLHKNIYANANPVYAWDPSGHFSLPEMLTVAWKTAGQIWETGYKGYKAIQAKRTLEASVMAMVGVFGVIFPTVAGSQLVYSFPFNDYLGKDWPNYEVAIGRNQDAEARIQIRIKYKWVVYRFNIGWGGQGRESAWAPTDLFSQFGANIPLSSLPVLRELPFDIELGLRFNDLHEVPTGAPRPVLPDDANPVQRLFDKGISLGLVIKSKPIFGWSCRAAIPIIAARWENGNLVWRALESFLE